MNVGRLASGDLDPLGDNATHPLEPRCGALVSRTARSVHQCPVGHAQEMSQE